MPSACRLDAVGYVVALADGELAIVSPPSSADDALFTQTDALGDVTALIANNTGHDLGQELWQKRYPLAVTYAPEVAVPQIAKAKKASRPLKPLAALASKLPLQVRFVDEILGHSPHLIGPAPFKLLFWITGSGPGLARNRIWSTAFAKDKKAIAATVLGELDTFRPTVLLPVHGNPIAADEFGKARERIAALG